MARVGQKAWGADAAAGSGRCFLLRSSASRGAAKRGARRLAPAAGGAAPRCCLSAAACALRHRRGAQRSGARSSAQSQSATWRAQSGGALAGAPPIASHRPAPPVAGDVPLAAPLWQAPWRRKRATGREVTLLRARHDQSTRRCGAHIGGAGAGVPLASMAMSQDGQRCPKGPPRAPQLPTGHPLLGTLLGSLVPLAMHSPADRICSACPR